ncbi:hypothetical protein AURDEDRAFT_169525 [Auricularia subglabra TFB-10046 SS5]|uniref:Uncharacterized protein n=1 Tax=Auricularia subglabra (strain TFB-10046 / SS5) TaxID=717982 RepID=J0D2R0_AURST|nr:hypothetical protein AURDEDRAFT_169525 [Auricularia subglabra TFB-10046 SS5]
MSRKVASLLSLPDFDEPMPWDTLDCSWTLPDEPVHKATAVPDGERTARPSPTRAKFAPQTRALTPDLRLASAALLALPQGSPAPAAPYNKSHITAANAATNALGPLPNMPPDAEKENVEPERRGRSSTKRGLYSSSAPTFPMQRRRAVAVSFAAPVAPDSPKSSPEPSPVRTTLRSGARAGGPTDPEPLVHDDDPSPLGLAMAAIDSPADAPMRSLRRVRGGKLPTAALRPRVRRAVNVSRSPLLDADLYDADEEEDWSRALPNASTARRDD